MNIADDAYDNQVGASTVSKRLSDRIAVAPHAKGIEETRIGLIDHHDLLACGAVAPCEVAATNPRTHSAHVAGRDDVNQRAGIEVVGTLGALRKWCTPGAILAKRKIVCKAG